MNAPTPADNSNDLGYHKPTVFEINDHYTLEKFEAIAALIDAEATGVDNGIYIEDTIQIVFQRPTNLARDKGRCRLAIVVYDGEEWHTCPLNEQIKITKSVRAIANDINRRVLEPAIQSRQIHRDGLERLKTELELSRRSLINLENVSPRTLTVKTYSKMLPMLDGHVEGVKVHGSTQHRRPDRINLTLDGLTQYAAERVLAIVRQHQPHDNADNV